MTTRIVVVPKEVVVMAKGEFYNLAMTQGERFFFRVERIEPSTGNKDSFVGWTATLRVGTGWNGTEIFTITGTVDSTGVSFAMSEALTLNEVAGSYVFDIFADGPNGPEPLLRGPFVIYPSAVGGAI